MNDVFLDDIVRSGEPDPGRRGTRRDGRKERDRRRRSRRRRNVVALVVTLVVVAAAGFGIWKYVLPAMGALQSLDVERRRTTRGRPTARSRSPSRPARTGTKMGQLLQEQGVVLDHEGVHQGVHRRPRRVGDPAGHLPAAARDARCGRGDGPAQPGEPRADQGDHPGGLPGRAGRPTARVGRDHPGGHDQRGDEGHRGDRPAGGGRWELRGLAVPRHLHLRARDHPGPDDQEDGRQDHLGPRRAQGRAG